MDIRIGIAIWLGDLIIHSPFSTNGQRFLYTAYTPENFRNFVDDYVDKLNGSYVDVTTINKDLIRRETVRGYNQISDTLGVHHPFHKSPRVKTMLFTPLISMVGVTGSMGPFFCEFTLNGDLLPSQYPATYAHELAHLLGISSEAEANFYAYQVCTRSQARGIRFCGYFSVLGHVLVNARRLMDEEEYKELFKRIRPEIIELAKSNREILDGGVPVHSSEIYKTGYTTCT